MGHLEADLEAWFRKRVRLLGGYVIKMVPIEAGVPDRLVIMPAGRMFLVELKTETGTVSPIQKVWHTKIAGTGTRVYVLRGRESCLQWLRWVVETTSPQSKRANAASR